MVAKKICALSLLVVAGISLVGCTTSRESVRDKHVSLETVEVQNADAVALTKFNYQIEGEDIDKAKVFAGQLSSPESRAMAFLRVALIGKEAIGDVQTKKESLTQAIQNLNAISNVDVKFALQQEFLEALFNLDVKHKQKALNEVYQEILDNFWETSTSLEANTRVLCNETITQINDSLSKSWVINGSQLKKVGLEGKILTARLRYALNPEKAKVEISTIKDQVWEIHPSANRVPYLLDLIEFEIDVTRDISEAKRLLKTLRNTLEPQLDA